MALPIIIPEKRKWMLVHISMIVHILFNMSSVGREGLSAGNPDVKWVGFTYQVSPPITFEQSWD